MRRNTARQASLAIVSLLGGAARLRQSLALQVGGEGVVVLQVAERRLGPAHRVGRDRGAFAARVDADLRFLGHLGSHSGGSSWTGPNGLGAFQSDVVRPRLGL